MGAAADADAVLISARECVSAAGQALSNLGAGGLLDSKM
jgi:hypothetical protein